MEEKENHRFSNISEPPRIVPFFVKCKMLMGIFTLIGTILFVSMSVFVIVFVLSSRAIPSLKMTKVDARTYGRVTHIARTSSSRGKGRSKRRIYRIHFEYEIDSIVFKQYSYLTGVKYKNKRIEIGQDVVIEYVSTNPMFSRIKGMRYSVFGSFMLFMLIFPIVGLGIYLFQHLRNFKNLALMKYGKLSRGTVTRYKPTTVKINRQKVNLVYFEYTDEGGNKQTARCRTLYKPVISDKTSKPILYNPNKPSVAMFIDAIPKGVKLDNNGNLIAKKDKKILLFLLSHLLVWSLTLIITISVIVQSMN